MQYNVFDRCQLPRLRLYISCTAIMESWSMLVFTHSLYHICRIFGRQNLSISPLHNQIKLFSKYAALFNHISRNNMKEISSSFQTMLNKTPLDPFNCPSVVTNTLSINPFFTILDSHFSHQSTIFLSRTLTYSFTHISRNLYPGPYWVFLSSAAALWSNNCVVYTQHFFNKSLSNEKVSTISLCRKLRVHLLPSAVKYFHTSYLILKIIHCTLNRCDCVSRIESFLSFPLNGLYPESASILSPKNLPAFCQMWSDKLLIMDFFALAKTHAFALWNGGGLTQTK